MASGFFLNALTDVFPEWIIQVGYVIADVIETLLVD